MALEADGTTTFIASRRRLELAVAASCDPSQPWAARVAAGIRTALELAEADPAAGRVLALPSANRGRGGSTPGFAGMVDRFAVQLGAGAPAIARPERTARNTVLRVARQVLLHIETRPGAPVTEIAPDLIVFALTPYVGLEQARRVAAATA